MMKRVSDCNGEGLSGEKPKRPLSDEQGDCSKNQAGCCTQNGL